MSYLVTLIAIFTTCCSGWDDKQRIYGTDGTESVIQVESIDEFATEFRSLGQEATLANEAINAIQFTAGQYVSSQRLQVRLVDGSFLMVDDFVVSDERGLQTMSDNKITQDIKIRNIASLAFAPVTPELSQRWQQLTESSEQVGDWLVFDREGTLDYIEGSAGSISTENVSFQVDGRTAEAPRQRLNGISYFHPGNRTFAEPVALLLMVDGSQLNLRSLRRSEGNGGFVAVTVCGAELRLPAEEIFKIDFAALRTQYLSNISPSTIEWEPIFYNAAIYKYQSELNRPRFNKSFSGRPLELRFFENQIGQNGSRKIAYEHGIAAKGGTRMVFPLGGRFSRLEGWFGFSPEAPRDGVVELVVLGDGKKLLRKVLKHQMDAPVALDLDVAEVGRLTFQVNYHDGRNIGDMVHFCDLKVRR